MIAIKNMPMPKNCYECWFEDANQCYLNILQRIESLDRPEWCPLVELPNTDLVDADTVEFWGEHEHGYTWTGKIVVHREKESVAKMDEVEE